MVSAHDSDLGIWGLKPALGPLHLVTYKLWQLVTVCDLDVNCASWIFHLVHSSSSGSASSLVQVNQLSADSSSLLHCNNVVYMLKAATMRNACYFILCPINFAYFFKRECRFLWFFLCICHFRAVGGPFSAVVLLWYYWFYFLADCKSEPKHFLLSCSDLTMQRQRLGKLDFYCICMLLLFYISMDQMFWLHGACCARSLCPVFILWSVNISLFDPCCRTPTTMPAPSTSLTISANTFSTFLCSLVLEGESISNLQSSCLFLKLRTCHHFDPLSLVMIVWNKNCYCAKFVISHFPH